MSDKTWWNSLTETERFEQSIELCVPDMSYSYLTESEKKKVDEANSFTNFGNQTGGNLTPMANGKSQISSSYGDPDVEELTEVSLNYMEKAKAWWDGGDVPNRKLWNDMRINERQRAINAYTMSNEVEEDDDLMNQLLQGEEVGEDDREKLETLKQNEEEEQEDGEDETEDIELIDSLLEKSAEEVELLTELAREAGEGGKGSGKAGHQQWMRGATEGPDYKDCPTCGIATELRQGKCSMCGKMGAKEVEESKTCSTCGAKVEGTGDECDVCLDDKFWTDESLINKQEEFDYNTIGEATMRESTETFVKPEIKEDYYVSTESNGVSFTKPKVQAEEVSIIPGEKATGKNVAMEAKNTLFCDCGFYTNNQGELNDHTC